MCIIVIKPRGIELPPKHTLKNCWRWNSDGAGYMVVNQQNQRVEINKGYMKSKSFFKAIFKRVTKDDIAVLHFRTATHGGVSQELTHPFPLTADIEHMIRLTSICAIGVAHNGIINNIPDTQDKISDTMQFIRVILANPIIRKNLQNPATKTLVTALAVGSKFCLLKGDGEIIKYGDGWIEDSGLIYSNSGYLASKYFASYDYEDYWDYADQNDLAKEVCVQCLNEDIESTYIGGEIWYECTQCHHHWKKPFPSVNLTKEGV